ncbi:YgfZ/GcvT domain-containing protein [Aureimonas leprariae]|uniref:Folate-binding protein YgfZ n=1 Tax=Plantimonas leprariae TaxID=2615207 RepID=A0A7V7PPZ5_9HYPH|nr:folate-binding protein YgfZ [Aureimonas leprariae]KAB0680120.1 folate-binding protein YgfZ [Aureimonas leprariae]
MPHARLADRATLLVTGDAASDFLQNLVTSDIESIGADEARPSALLTPQGKILFDFLVSRVDGGFRLDVAAGARGDLAKRLTLYRLRAKVGIAPSDEPVFAVWETERSPGFIADRRFPGDAVFRAYEGLTGGEETEAAEFEALRIRAGVAEAERDFPASDVFPHDVLLDQNGGISFRKGCYVGQEVVSRMQHRGTARRRLMLAEAERHLTPGADILAGGKSIGTVLSAAGREGMVMVRIDRLAGALNSGGTVEADGVPVELTIPEWAGYALPDAASAAAVAD